jgi:hypothetical protein
VTWLDDDDSPNAARTLEALGLSRRIGEPGEMGTTILLYDGPSSAYLHVIKQLSGDLYESKCGDGPRIALRRPPERWYEREGCQRSDWFLGNATRDLAIERLEPYIVDEGRVVYRILGASPSAAQRPATVASPPRLESVRDVLQDCVHYCGLPAPDAVKWLENELDRPRSHTSP